jgi:ketosteroid isomerase-like protein
MGGSGGAVDVIMAAADYGRGRVFALGDPWLYNEYVDGKKLPAGFDNFSAARELAYWLLDPPAPEPVWKGEEKKVAEAVETLRQAMISGDRKALENIAATELSYGHSGGAVEDKAAFVEKIASGRSDFEDIALTGQTIVVSGETAVVRHRLAASTRDAGKEPGSIQLAVLLVWVKQKGAWKLLARQAVKI